MRADHPCDSRISMIEAGVWIQKKKRWAGCFSGSPWLVSNLLSCFEKRYHHYTKHESSSVTELTCCRMEEPAVDDAESALIQWLVLNLLWCFASASSRNCSNCSGEQTVVTPWQSESGVPRSQFFEGISVLAQVLDAGSVCVFFFVVLWP